MSGTLIWAVSALAAVAAEDKLTSPIPLSKGTRWVYEAKVKWTPVAGSGQSGVQSARLKWTTEVLECVQGEAGRAAVVHAFPMEVLGFDPSQPDGYTILIELSNRLFTASAHSEAQALRLAREFTAAPEKGLSRAELLLEMPLQVDRRWACCTDGPPREDGWYCWRVEAQKTRKLHVKGVPAGELFKVSTVAYRTCPDHQVLDIAPGVGITRLEYVHHGTIASEDVRLVEFARGR